MDRSASFARVAGRLGDLHVVRYDRRGYGRSRAARPPVGIEGDVEDLLEVVAAHASPGTSSVVVGHSYGGVVALAAAARHPGTVAAVGAFEAPMPWLPWWPEITAGSAAVANGDPGDADGDPGDAAEAFLRRMLGDERWEALPAATRRNRRLEGPALAAEVASMHTGVAPFDLDVLAVSVVAGHGTRSAARHQRAAQELAKATGGQPFVVQGADHGAHLSHPHRFAEYVRTVVAAVNPARK